ncbi:MAG: ATP-binding protein, partial [Candidatus Sericytochromatia bacterium]
MSPADRYRYFRIEAKELLEGLAAGVLALERETDAHELKRLLRLAHTLKGAARVVEQGEIAEAAHALEEVLQPLQGHAGPAPKAAVDAALALTDAIGEALGRLSEEPPAELLQAPAAPQAAEEPSETVRVSLADLETLLAGIAEANVQLDGLRQRLGGEGAGARDLTDRLDRAQNELEIVRERAHHMRLLPAHRIFGQLERAGRDVAARLEKTVLFEAAGGETRLDGHVLLELRDALLHLVRNAVDHGIESPFDRRRAGKPPEGRLRLEVERRGDRVAFVLEDDGRGLDLQAIRKAAVARGLIGGEDEAIAEGDLTRLLFESGFSTRKDVTEISGRGVGLDVVRDVVSRLKGELRVETAPGRGLRVEAIVPLSLLAIKALVVEAGGVVGAIPLDAVMVTARVGAGELVRSGDREALLVEDVLIPFMPLAERPIGDDAAWSVVVVQAGTGRAAIGVERILEVADAVVRPLPVQLGALPLVSGASFDAEGVPRPIYDPVGLVSAVRDRPAPKPSAPRPRRKRILVVDDSLTTRMLEASILESAGYEVTLAASGEEGLAKAREGSYDLMIVDVEMPGMSGFEVV